jgi:hypothetical protein
MDFAFTPEQEALRRAVRAFIQSGVNRGGVHVMRDQVARRGLGMPRAKR